MTIKAQDIATLVELFEASQWDELHVELDGLHLFLSTDPKATLASATTPQSTSALAPIVASVAEPAVAVPTPATAPKADVQSIPVAAVPSNWTAVTAPNLGTFYRAPKPGAPAYVEVGQPVEPSSEICLLEVMKLFTSVTAGTKGIVRRICANDGDMVEFGQTLFYIEPV